MHNGEPLRGIERKILRSILWVGVLPLSLALLFGYFTVRASQHEQTKDTLQAATQNLTLGLRYALESYLVETRNIALDPEVIAALSPAANGVPNLTSAPEQFDSLRQRLQRSVGSSSRISRIAFYDSSGQQIESVPMPADDFVFPEILREVEEAAIVGVNRDTDGTYVAYVAAPVGEEDPLGFVVETVSIGPLLTLASGFQIQHQQRADQDFVMQLVFNRRGQIYTSNLEWDSTAGSPRLSREAADPQLAAIFRQTNHPSSDALFLRNYRSGFEPRDVFLAYQKLSGAPWNGYVVLYSEAGSVLSLFHISAITLLGGLVLLIAFVNAHRHVHNNIVRPVLLLNEGAQIIGQGDLELKLKIGTGDEIEELAMSFNKMALALKRNIRQLEESEEKYRSLVTSMRDGIFQTDAHWQFTFMNPAGMDIFGFRSVEQVMEENFRNSFLEKSDFDRVRSELEEKGFIERSRIWMKRRDGRAICVELSGNPMLDDNTLGGVEGIFRDVTKSVRLEREARDRADRLSAINQIANVINSSLEAGKLFENLVVEVQKLVDFDTASLSLLDDSGEFFRVRQLRPELAAEMEAPYPIDDVNSCAAWVAREERGLIVGDNRNRETPFTREFSSKVRAAISAPLYASGKIIGTLNLGSETMDMFSERDMEALEQVAPHVAVAIRNAKLLENLQGSLQEVTRAREKLHEANEELKTLDEMKTNLLSNVSHELRTPLVSIMGYTDMIYNGKAGSVNETQREYLTITLRNVEKLVTLIENLLDFSRLHSGAETLVFDTLDLLELARSSLQIIQPVADGRDISLHLKAPEDPILVDGDKGKLGQVFNNLLANAVKFNRAKGSVTVEIQCNDSVAEVSVSDTGIGIPREALDKVFTRFYQYDSSSTRKYGGTGIGLAIAQDIMRLHGGRITVSSEEGKGSTFRFGLPMRITRASAESSARSDALVPAETHLLIELITQDRALSAHVRTLLVPERIDLIHAETASHALALAEKHSPDCILVDMEPSEDGVRIINTLANDSRGRELPVVIITNDDTLHARFRDIVASRVKRSFRKSTLLSGIHHALNQNRIGGAASSDRVLCVDDDDEILMFMIRVLEGAGYDAEGATSGERALEMLSNGDFGLVLLDIAMPGIDGWEVCRRIKADPRLSGVSVYMVTAKPIDSNALRRHRSRADGFILKPFRAEDLAELVHGLLPLPAVQEG